MSGFFGQGTFGSFWESGPTGALFRWPEAAGQGIGFSIRGSSQRQKQSWREEPWVHPFRFCLHLLSAYYMLGIALRARIQDKDSDTVDQEPDPMAPQLYLIPYGITCP